MMTHKQTPLLDLLRGISITARGSYSQGDHVTCSVPYGSLAHRAADEIESLRQQLTTVTAERDAYMRDYGEEQDRKREVAQKLTDSRKREVMLRDALEYHQSQTRPIQATIEALTTTAALSGVILCHAEPAAWQFVDDEELGYTAYNQKPPRPEQVEYLKEWNRPEWEPLYRAWEPKEQVK